MLVFILDYFREKLRTNFFKKSKKPFLVAFSGLFGQNECFQKSGLCQFLSIPIIYHCTKLLEKASDPFLRKMLNFGRKKRGSSDFFHKKGGFSKVGGYFKKGGYHLLTQGSQQGPLSWVVYSCCLSDNSCNAKSFYILQRVIKSQKVCLSFRHSKSWYLFFQKSLRLNFQNCF